MKSWSDMNEVAKELEIIFRGAIEAGIPIVIVGDYYVFGNFLKLIYNLKQENITKVLRNPDSFLIAPDTMHMALNLQERVLLNFFGDSIF